MLKYLIGSGTTLLIIVYLLLKYPDSVQKYLSGFTWIISRLWKKGEYVAIKQEVQGKINCFVDDLHDNTTANFSKIKISWVGDDEKERIDFEDYETIIVMRDRKSRNKNFIHAAFFYTSEVLLNRSKKYLSSNQKKSLDLFATKKILEGQSRASIEEFMQGYFLPALESSKINDYIKDYKCIDESGLFFPVLIQELTYFGNKAVLSYNDKRGEIIKEVKDLIKFLKDFAERKVGDDTPDMFVGKYITCSIKIVASKMSREKGNFSGHKDRICDCLNANCDNVYVIGGATKDNKIFINGVVDAVISEKKEVEKGKILEFSGKVNIRGKIVKLKTYFVHIQNSTPGNDIF